MAVFNYLFSHGLSEYLIKDFSVGKNGYPLFVFFFRQVAQNRLCAQSEIPGESHRKSWRVGPLAPELVDWSRGRWGRLGRVPFGSVELVVDRSTSELVDAIGLFGLVGRVGLPGGS